MYYLADFYAGCATPKGFVSHGVSKVKTKKPSIHLFSAYPIQGGGGFGGTEAYYPNRYMAKLWVHPGQIYNLLQG